MSDSKKELKARAKRWPMLAEAHGFRCAVCGAPPKFEERAAFFDTGKCGFHAYVSGPEYDDLA